MSAVRRLRPVPCAHSRRGLSLAELLIALTIGLLLLGGTISVYLKSRDAHAAMETTARLQEVGRYALAVIESDVRMSGFLGLMSRPELVTNLGGPVTDPAGAPAALRGCTETWATDLARHLHGWDHADGAWPLGEPCRPSGRWKASSDGLIVRRASAERIAQSAAGLREFNRHVLIVSSRTAGQVFVGDAAGTIPADYAQSDPADAAPLADTRRLLVNAYYVSADSSEARGHPSLRRKRLVAGPAVQDEEIMPGVEDLQVQYGLDTDGDASADRYVNAGEPEPGAAIVSARIWLRIRAADRDVSWQDTNRYAYANQDERVAPDERQFRRIVVSRTITLRNGRDP